MDVAYDHIQEEALSPQHESNRNNDLTNPSSSSLGEQSQQTSQQATSSPANLNEEFQQAFAAVSASPWGSKLGGWFSTARKQGETFYNDLSKEASEASEQATKGFVDLRQQLVSRTRGMSLGVAEPGPTSEIPGEEGLPGASGVKQQKEASRGTDDGTSESKQRDGGDTVADKPESLPADIVKEATSLVASFRSTAAAKLKDIQKAEDAADDALLRFGGNVRDFLRSAVTITAPDAADIATSTDSAGNEVLFETSEPGTGRKVFHSTRLEAQLHAIHTNIASFSHDPTSGERWEAWTSEFDIDEKTDEIAKDLEKHSDLRRAMERLVPEKVEYRDFWRRYYFLRTAVEEDEKKRREVLKGSTIATPAEEVSWDNSDSEKEDDGDDESSTPNATNKMSQSTTTLNAPPSAENKDGSEGLLKPTKSPRRSHEEASENKSVADSDASYDIVSGATSRAPGSPKEEKKKGGEKDGEESDDDDWE